MKYTFRSTKDHQSVTTIATSEMEAFAQLAFIADRKHGIKPSRFTLIEVDGAPLTPSLF